MRGGGTRPPALPAAARAPRAASRLRRRRAAWLRIFVVGCSLPCDPPVGGHSCNKGIIPRFYRAVQTRGTPCCANEYSRCTNTARFVTVAIDPTYDEVSMRSLGGDEPRTRR